jgi:hypothetical protein
MDRRCLLLLVFTVAFPIVGCKSKSTVAPAPATTAATPRPIVPDISGLTDAQILKANRTADLAFALRIPGKSFKLGEPIPLHLLIEDFSGKPPIASGLCEGLVLHYSNTATQDGGGSDIVANSNCFAGTPYPDSVPLEKGKIKTVDLILQSSTHIDLPIGSYLIDVEWKVYPVGPPSVVAPPPFATLNSNQVPITVTQ